MNTPTQKQSKVKLLLDAKNVRLALDDYEFDDLALTLGVSENQIKNALLTAAMARTTVKYTHGVLKFNFAERQKLQQKGRILFEPYVAHRKWVGDRIWPRSDRASRILIDTAIIPAVAEAQKQQNSSPATIVTRGNSCLSNPSDCLVITQDYQSSALTSEVGKSVCTSIDYVVLLAPSDSYALMKEGYMPLEDMQGSPLLAIVEAKSPDDWEAARRRLAVHCIAMLKDTGRNLFPAVLTSGTLWTFNAAVADGDGKITVYESHPCGWNIDDISDAFIFGTLIELLASPCVLPPVFELGRHS
ncbi:hypothetical protein C8R43DRAFT_1242316 [Mycena crocata]|nr:hypothetical protein C8R43DRAFT_1242316 [Mycena crocata]